MVLCTPECIKKGCFLAVFWHYGGCYRVILGVFCMPICMPISMRIAWMVVLGLVMVKMGIVNGKRALYMFQMRPVDGS